MGLKEHVKDCVANISGTIKYDTQYPTPLNFFHNPIDKDYKS